MLSSNRQLNITASCAHALGLQWAKWATIDKDVNAENALPSPLDPDSGAALELSWRKWARSETRKRAMLAQYILDAQIASFSEAAESVVKHMRNQCRVACSDELWDAPTAADWARVMERERAERAKLPSDPSAYTFRELFVHLFDERAPDEDEIVLPSLSALSLYVLLEGIVSLTHGLHDAEAYGEAVGDLSAIDISRALSRWHQLFRASPSAVDDRLGLMMRWHCAFIAVLADVTRLEVALRPHAQSNVDMGSATPRASRAPSPSGSHSYDMVSWFRTPRARRALIHAAAVRTLAERAPFGREALPHSIGCIYTAAVVVQACSIALTRLGGHSAFSSLGNYDLARAADANWQAIGEVGLDDGGTPVALVEDPTAAYIANGGVPKSDGSPIGGSIAMYAY